jgi:hypothetical protein
MATIAEFLSSLADLDIRLWVEDGRLRFNAPKGALSPDLRDGIAARRSELVAFLSQGAGDAIPPAPGDGPPPLSFAQQRLWFLDQFQGASDTYNLSAALRITGRLDGEALARALEAMVARFETLRTTVAVGEGGDPVQVIHSAAAFPLPRHDLSGSAPLSGWRRRASAWRRRPPDPSTCRGTSCCGRSCCAWTRTSMSWAW